MQAVNSGAGCCISTATGPLPACPVAVCNLCTLFGRLFVKRFALCYRSVVWLSVLPALSVTLVHCGQTVGWIKMKLGTQIGLGPGHMVLDGDPAPPPLKGHSPLFSANARCGQTAGWIKLPVGMEVDLGPFDVVLDGVAA